MKLFIFVVAIRCLIGIMVRGARLSAKAYPKTEEMTVGMVMFMQVVSLAFLVWGVWLLVNP